MSKSNPMHHPITPLTIQCKCDGYRRIHQIYQRDWDEINEQQINDLADRIIDGSIKAKIVNPTHPQKASNGKS